MEKSTELLLTIYQELYAQKSVLPNAPAMTISPEEQKSETFDREKAHQEVGAVVGYLLGKSDISTESWENLLNLINQYYAKQPEWKKILLDYLEYLLELDTEKNTQMQKKLLGEIQDILNQPK